MKRINKIKYSKTFYIVVSCLASLILWMYVVNYENKDMEQPINGIDVEFVGEDDILADRQLVVSSGYDQTVSLKLIGKRSVVGSLDKDDVKVQANLSHIRVAGQYEIVYTVDFPNMSADEIEDFYIIDKQPEYISVSIDQMIKKDVEIHGEFDGSVTEGYLREPVEYDPQTIEVSGPAEEVSKVAEAWVVVQRENLTKTVTGIVGFTLRDEDGNTVSSDEISTDVQAVKYIVPVMMVKDVVLTVDIVEGGGALRENASVEINPPVVTLSGAADILNGINRITLGTIDLGDIATSLNKSYTISLPNDVNNLSGETEASISVAIKGLTIRRIITSIIEVSNVSEGYTAAPITQYREVLIRGPEDVVNKVAPENVRMVADLTNIRQAVGRYTVPVTVSVDGYEGVGVVGSDYNVVVSVEVEKD